MARRPSLWDQLAHDRELRRRQNDRAARVQRQIERELAADAARARTASDKEAKARERRRIEDEHLAGLAEAEEQNSRLSGCVDELSTMLRRCVYHRAPSVDDLRVVEVALFDPGPDGERLVPPRRPVMEDGGLLSWARRRREFDEAMQRYTRDVAIHQEDERRRLTRFKAAAYDQMVAAERAAADARAERIRHGLGEGDPTSIEEFAGVVITGFPLPGGINLDPKIVYRSEPREIVADICLPDGKIVPGEKSVKYVRTRREFTVKDRSRTELESMYRGVLAQLPLCVLHSLFRACAAQLV